MESQFFSKVLLFYRSLPEVPPFWSNKPRDGTPVYPCANFGREKRAFYAKKEKKSPKILTERNECVGGRDAGYSEQVII